MIIFPSMYKRSGSKWCLLAIIASLSSCAAVQFYNEPDKPFFYSGKDSLVTLAPADSLDVVTFNIKKAEKIDLAITELQQLEKNTGVDIYLLQEMNEQGVQAIAKALRLNYLYIPIVYDRTDKKNIGNAILTKGTIGYPEKLILPHAKWQNQQRRDVTIGEVTIHDKKILVYSVHTETFAMSRKKRMDQVDTIIEHLRKQSASYQYVLVGGDFNTLFTRDGRTVIDKFRKAGFNWSTQAVGTTARPVLGMIKPRHDYVFSRGLQVKNAYKVDASKSSDHYPVFATFGY